MCFVSVVFLDALFALQNAFARCAALLFGVWLFGIVVALLRVRDKQIYTQIRQNGGGGGWERRHTVGCWMCVT